MRTRFGDHVHDVDLKPVNFSRVARQDARDAATRAGDNISSVALVETSFDEESPEARMHHAAQDAADAMRTLTSIEGVDWLFFLRATWRPDGGLNDSGAAAIFLVSRDTAMKLRRDDSAAELVHLLPERPASAAEMFFSSPDDGLILDGNLLVAWRKWTAPLIRGMSLAAAEKKCRDAVDPMLPTGATLPDLLSEEIILGGRPAMSSRTAKWSSFYVSADGSHANFRCSIDIPTGRATVSF